MLSGVDVHSKHSQMDRVVVVIVCVCVSSSPVSRQLSDDSYRPTPLSPLNISPLLLPASTSRTSPQQQHLIDGRRMSSSWDVPHTVELVRKPGDSLGISIVGGLRLLCAALSALSAFSSFHYTLCSTENVAVNFLQQRFNFCKSLPRLRCLSVCFCVFAWEVRTGLICAITCGTKLAMKQG